MNSLTNARAAVRRGIQHLLFRARRENTDSCCSRQTAGCKIAFIRSSEGLEEKRERHTRFHARFSCFTSSTGWHYSYTAMTPLLHLHCPSATYFGVASQRHLSFYTKFFSPNPSPFRNLQTPACLQLQFIGMARETTSLHRLPPPLFIETLPQHSPSEKVISTLCDNTHHYRWRFTTISALS